MSHTGETPHDVDPAEADAQHEMEDMEISKEEADAVSGGAVSSTTPTGPRHGA